MTAIEGVVAGCVGCTSLATLGLCGAAQIKQSLHDKKHKAASLPQLAREAFQEPIDSKNISTDKGKLTPIAVRCSTNGKDERITNVQMRGEVLMLSQDVNKPEPAMALGGASIKQKGEVVTATAKVESLTLKFADENDAIAWATVMKTCARKQFPPATRVYELVEHIVKQEQELKDKSAQIQRLTKGLAKAKKGPANTEAAAEDVSVLSVEKANETVEKLREQREKIADACKGITPGNVNTPQAHAVKPAEAQPGIPVEEHASVVEQFKQLQSEYGDLENRSRQKDATIQTNDARIQTLQKQIEEYSDHITRQQDVVAHHEQQSEAQKRDLNEHRHRIRALEDELASTSTQSHLPPEVMAQLQDAERREAEIRRQAQEDQEILRKRLSSEFEQEYTLIRRQVQQAESDALEKQHAMEAMLREKGELLQELQTLQEQKEALQGQGFDPHAAMHEAKVKELETHIHNHRKNADEILQINSAQAERIQQLESQLGHAPNHHGTTPDLAAANAALQEQVRALSERVYEFETNFNAPTDEEHRLRAEVDSWKQQLQQKTQSHDAEMQSLAAEMQNQHTAEIQQQAQSHAAEIRELQQQHLQDSIAAPQTVANPQDQELIRKLAEENAMLKGQLSNSPQDQEGVIRTLTEENAMLKGQMSNTWAQINEQMEILADERRRYMEEVPQPQYLPQTADAASVQEITQPVVPVSLQVPYATNAYPQSPPQSTNSVIPSGPVSMPTAEPVISQPLQYPYMSATTQGSTPQSNVPQAYPYLAATAQSAAPQPSVPQTLPYPQAAPQSAPVISSAPSVFSSMDTSRDGLVSKQEFISAMLAKGFGKSGPPQQAGTVRQESYPRSFTLKNPGSPVAPGSPDVGAQYSQPNQLSSSMNSISSHHRGSPPPLPCQASTPLAAQPQQPAYQGLAPPPSLARGYPSMNYRSPGGPFSGARFPSQAPSFSAPGSPGGFNSR